MQRCEMPKVIGKDSRFVMPLGGNRRLERFQLGGRSPSVLVAFLGAARGRLQFFLPRKHLGPRRGLRVVIFQTHDWGAA